jgi:hypothetical protein
LALRERLPSATLSWLDGANPPDFNLTIDSRPYAVEVTAFMRTLTMGRKPMSMPAVVEHLVELVREAENRVRGANLLRGTFVVHCPRPIEGLGARREELVAGIWTAVGFLWSQPEGSSEVFYRQRGRIYQVTKVRNEGAVLYLGGPTDSIWRGEATMELKSLIEERLAAKRKALRDVATPWVLLLEERYPYADAEMYHEIPNPPSGANEFAAIFVVRSQNSGVTLRSTIPGLDGLW